MKSATPNVPTLKTHPKTLRTVFTLCEKRKNERKGREGGGRDKDKDSDYSPYSHEFWHPNQTRQNPRGTVAESECMECYLGGEEKQWAEKDTPPVPSQTHKEGSEAIRLADSMEIPSERCSHRRVMAMCALRLETALPDRKERIPLLFHSCSFTVQLGFGISISDTPISTQLLQCFEDASTNIGQICFDIHIYLLFSSIYMICRKKISEKFILVQ